MDTRVLWGGFITLSIVLTVFYAFQYTPHTQIRPAFTLPNPTLAFDSPLDEMVLTSDVLSPFAFVLTDDTSPITSFTLTTTHIEEGTDYTFNIPVENLYIVDDVNREIGVKGQGSSQQQNLVDVDQTGAQTINLVGTSGFVPDAQVNNGVFLYGDGYTTSGGFTVGNNDFTIELWVYPQTDQQATLVSQGVYDGGVHGYALSITSDATLFLIGDGTTTVAVTGPALPTTEFSHVAAVRESGGVIKLYIDGSHVAEAGASSVGSLDTNEAFLLGTITNEQTGDLETSFFGLLDEVAVFGDSLDAATIQQHYQNGENGDPVCTSCPPSLMKYWKLDEENSVRYGPGHYVVVANLVTVQGTYQAEVSYELVY